MFFVFLKVQLVHVHDAGHRCDGNGGVLWSWFVVFSRETNFVLKLLRYGLTQSFGAIGSAFRFEPSASLESVESCCHSSIRALSPFAFDRPNTIPRSSWYLCGKEAAFTADVLVPKVVRAVNDERTSSASGLDSATAESLAASAQRASALFVEPVSFGRARHVD